jgi:hypothetical protein
MRRGIVAFRAGHNAVLSLGFDTSSRCLYLYEASSKCGQSMIVFTTDAIPSGNRYGPLSFDNVREVNVVNKVPPL